MATSWQSQMRFLALIAFVLAIISTAIGGWADITKKPGIISKKHAWNDGIFLVLAAIFLLMLSFF
jgi:hypothetical protein